MRILFQIFQKNYQVLLHFWNRLEFFFEIYKTQIYNSKNKKVQNFLLRFFHVHLSSIFIKFQGKYSAFEQQFRKKKSINPVKNSRK